MASSAREENSGFPITLWPGTPLPLLKVARGAVSVGRNGFLKWDFPYDEVELPDQWVIQELWAADLADDQVVVDLLSQYGEIRTPFTALGGTPLPVRQPSENGAAIEDARWWLRAAACSFPHLVQRSGREASSRAWNNEGFQGITTENIAWGQFTGALNAGLKAYQPRAEYRLRRNNGVRDFQPLTVGAPYVDLYSAACCQVFNLIVREDVASLCESETCNSVFVRQRGGAVYGQYRSKGVRFCSVGCARNETQRQYRRRQAQERTK